MHVRTRFRCVPPAEAPLARAAARLVAAGLVGAGLVGAGLVGATACSTAAGSSGGARTGPVRVVAAENFWGSIAQQLGGSRVAVTSIIDSPDADPHDYEPTPAAGRAVATADLVLVNGVGYDTWAGKLVQANPDPRRTLLTVGDLVGVPAGGNPHRWYNPDDVRRVIARLTADYKQLDPAGAADYDRRRAAFEGTALAGYRRVIEQIKARYAGTPVGASESIFAMAAPALGLHLVTPAGLLTAVSQGTEPTAADKAAADAQIKSRAIKVYVYNSQNATPDVQAQVVQARVAGIPVTAITETLTPATASFQDWQTAQLTALRDALAKATGR
jgi:zinc/manganese transport system substrate-binding protein